MRLTVTAAALLGASLVFPKTIPADENTPLLKVGQKAPDFKITGIDGKPIELKKKLQDERHNVVLIFSRANW